jgi:hypothetical protein
MRSLIDTCVISDFIKGDANTLSKIKQMPATDIASLWHYSHGVTSLIAKFVRRI